MPKLKTNKSAAKRFKVTKTGKILRRCAGKRHLLSSKARKRKRRLARAVVLKPMEAARMAKLLGLMG